MPRRGRSPTNIGEVKAQAKAGVGRVDDGLVASKKIEDGIGEVPAIIAEAQEQLATLKATLGRLASHDDLPAAAVTASESIRDGAVIIQGAFHGAVQAENDAVYEQAHTLHYDKDLKDLKTYGRDVGYLVDSANHGIQLLDHSLGQLSGRLALVQELNETVRDQATSLRDNADRQADAF